MLREADKMAKNATKVVPILRQGGKRSEAVTRGLVAMGYQLHGHLLRLLKQTKQAMFCVEMQRRIDGAGFTVSPLRLPRVKRKLKGKPCSTSRITLISMPAHSPDFYKLIEMGVPRALLEILLLLVVNPSLAMAGPLDAAELFAGVASVTAGMRAQKLTCIPYEIKPSEHMDMLSCTGFGLALTLVLRMGMAGRGLLWMAPVCSSWVFMSMGTTMRTRWTPEGDSSVECVRKGNLMVCRCVLLAALAHAMNLTWIIEQPSSSVMVYHPRMQWLAKLANVYWVGGIHMGACGGDSQKTLKLYSNDAWIEELH